MGGDGHHKPQIPIPDYKIYKIEGIPQLEAVQKHLASKCLRDPWLRNEAWRYDPRIWGNPTSAQKWIFMFCRGFKYGLGAFVVTVACEMAWAKMKGGDDSHGHGHGH